MRAIKTLKNGRIPLFQVSCLNFENLKILARMKIVMLWIFAHFSLNTFANFEYRSYLIGKTRVQLDAPLLSSVANGGS